MAAYLIPVILACLIVLCLFIPLMTGKRIREMDGLGKVMESG